MLFGSLDPLLSRALARLVGSDLSGLGLRLCHTSFLHYWIWIKVLLVAPDRC
jgi:hypothetical protein